MLVLTLWTVPIILLTPFALTVERAFATRQIARGEVAVNDSRHVPFIVGALLLPCMLNFIVTIKLLVVNEFEVRPGDIMCVTHDGTLRLLIAVIIPAVENILLYDFNTLSLQLIIAMLSLLCILYVYVTNRQVHARWVRTRTADQTLSIRVSLQRNMDIAGALIVSGLIYTALTIVGCLVALISAALHEAHLPLAQHVEHR